MKHVKVTIWLCAWCLVLTAPFLLAQESETMAPEEEEEAIPEVTYSIKTITLAVFGGYTTGATFLDLPPLEDRTQLEEGSNEVYRYDGTIFDLPDYYDAPQKKIESSNLFGGRIGFYLSDEFHLDLVMSVAKSRAVTTFLNRDPRLPREIRQQKDEDPNFASYSLGGNLMYDVNSFKLFGLTPHFGVGIGGIINTFGELQDKSALYFSLLGGLAYNVAAHYNLYLQFKATTFSFDTEELSYGKQVNYVSMVMGVARSFDVTPK
jgi:hypothetical protein